MANSSSSELLDGFSPLDPGRLVDGDLELVLHRSRTAIPGMGWVPGYEFHMMHNGTVTRMGSVALRVGDVPDFVGHLGYSVEPGFRGKRYAAKACVLLLPLARSHDMDVLRISCSPGNAASRRTCEIMGAEYLGLVKVPEDHEMYELGERQMCVYTLYL